MNINEILDFIATTDLHESWLVEDLRDCHWNLLDGELRWEKDEEDYSADCVRDVVQLDGLTFANGDTGQGYKLTYVLSDNMRVATV